MDDRRFDALARRFAGRLSRRAALRTGGAGLAGALGLTTARPRLGTARQATPALAADPPPSMLFVQVAGGGTFRPASDAAGPAELALTGVSDRTIFFSDRPQRLTGTVPTAQFVAGAVFDPADPPNAALVAQTEAGEDVLVATLANPRYDAPAGTVTYDATVLADYGEEGLAPLARRQQDGRLPERFGAASLFIDSAACESVPCQTNSDCQTYMVGAACVAGCCCWTGPGNYWCRPGNNAGCCSGVCGSNNQCTAR